MKLFVCVLGFVLLQASLLEASKNAGPKGNNRGDSGTKGGDRGGGWGTTGDRNYGGHRNRREIDDIADDADIEVREKRSFAPGAPSFPAPQQGSNNGQRGSWGVSANKDKGQGTQIRTEAQGNIYSNGRVRVDGQGYHEFGKGRKPSFGGSIRGRWRRDVDELVREKRQFNFMPGPQPPRFPQPQPGRFPQPTPSNRGSIGVTVDRQPGGGPHIRTDAQGNIFTSRNGNWRVDGTGFHEAGKGMKPNYGVGVQVQGRFRRDIDEDEQLVEEDEAAREKREANPQDRGSVQVSVDRPPGGHTQVRTDATGNIYTSQNGNWRVDGTGFHEAGHGRKPSYGGGIQITGRFRRDAEEIEEFTDDFEVEDEGAREKREANPRDRGSVTVSVDKPQGGRTQVRTDAKGNIYTSKNGNWRVDGTGFHEAGHGRKPSYGGGIQVQGRFRREIDEEETEDEEFVDDAEPAEREKRSPDSSGRKIIKTVYIRPLPVKPIRVPIRKVREVEDLDEFVIEEQDEEETRDKRSVVDRRPLPGTGPLINRPIHRPFIDRPIRGPFIDRPNRGPYFDRQTKPFIRYARDIDETEEPIEAMEETREKRSADPKDPRGSVSVTVDKGPRVRTDAQYNIYRKKNFEVNSHAFHEAARGQKPNYGGGISLIKRF